VNDERSPLKDRPLRLPGQSLSEERRALWDDKLEPWLLVALFMVALAVTEWFRYFTQSPPHPILFSVIAALFVAFGGWKLWRAKPKLRQLRQAIEGERAVGEYLGGLRTRGYRVFHDLIGPRFNLDHVLVGPAGVFTIETKTWSKPSRGEARVVFDGETLTAGRHAPDRDPVTQARAQASWLRALILESTGRTVDVFPVVVFPGWYVEQAAASRRTIWVLEPKALPSFLDQEPLRLRNEDVQLISFHLSRFVRSTQGPGM
jgi:hypothetical protein